MRFAGAFSPSPEALMAQNFEFYDERAREAAREATVATLDNVRERALRSEKAWRVMADRALTIEQDRVEAKRARDERIALELAEADAFQQS
jgi:hypothetical protein